MDIDKIIAEVERLDRCATKDWRQEGCKIKCGPNGSMLTKDAHGYPMFIAYDDASAAVYCRNAAPLLAAEVQRLRAGGCARDQRTTQFCAESVAKDAEIAKLRDQILGYQQSLHVTERERDMLRADLEAAAGEVLVPIPEPGTVAAKMLLANRLLKSEIHRIKRTMIEPTEQTGDEDSEQ